MSEQKLDRILSLIFRRVRVNELAKAKLKQRLFNSELSDDDLSLVSAAGDAAGLHPKSTEKKDLDQN